MTNQQQTPSAPRGYKQYIVPAVALLGSAVAGGVLEHECDEWSRNPPPMIRFSPTGGCTTAITDVVNGAKKEIHVQAYVFDSFDIARSLIDAHDRGVVVQVLMDKSCQHDSRNLAPYLFQKGVAVRVDELHAIAHNKVIVVDGTRVVTGSFNFTQAAETKNAENLVIFSDPTIADQYNRNWELHWGHSIDYSPDPPDPTPISPEEAANRPEQVCTVEMEVASIGSYGGNVFLNSRGYRVPGNFALMIKPTATPGRFKEWGDFANYLNGIQGKRIRVAGKVKQYEVWMQIIVNTPDQLLVLPDVK